MEAQESAETIQRWWRRKLESDRRVAERTRNIAESQYLSKITLQNDNLIAKLAQLRKEKAIDVLRYERIINLPAREVNDFMSKELGEDIEGRKTLLEEKELEERHRAARIIQRTFRRYCRQSIARKYLRSVNIIKPSQRVAYLEKINNRLGVKKTVRVVPLDAIRSKLSEHKTRRASEAEQFAQRQQLIQDMKRASISLTMASLEMLHSSRLSSLTVSSPLAQYKAEVYHEEQMAKIEEDEWA